MFGPLELELSELHCSSFSICFYLLMFLSADKKECQAGHAQVEIQLSIVPTCTWVVGLFHELKLADSEAPIYLSLFGQMFAFLNFKLVLLLATLSITQTTLTSLDFSLHILMKLVSFCGWSFSYLQLHCMTSPITSHTFFNADRTNRSHLFFCAHISVACLS